MKSSTEFLWDEESPLYKTGGWEANNDEYKSIFFSSLLSPKFLSKHLTESVKITFSQLFNFDIDGKADFGPLAIDSYSTINIKSHFNHEYNSYQYSRQQWGVLEFESLQLHIRKILSPKKIIRELQNICAKKAWHPFVYHP